MQFPASREPSESHQSFPESFGFPEKPLTRSFSRRFPALHKGQCPPMHAAQKVSLPGCTRRPLLLQVRLCSSRRFRVTSTSSALHGTFPCARVLPVILHYKLQMGGWQEVVNISRLKPTFTPDDAFPAQRPKRGHPRAQPPAPFTTAKLGRGCPPSTAKSCGTGRPFSDTLVPLVPSG